MRDLEKDLEFVGKEFKPREPICLMGVDMWVLREWLERAIKAEAEVERLQTLLETFNGECVVCDSVSEITKAQVENAKLRKVVEAAREYKTAFDTAVANPNKHGMALYSLMDNVARAETLLFEALDE